jgi:endonuclease YncB( thermonuclease family)
MRSAILLGAALIAGGGWWAYGGGAVNVLGGDNSSASSFLCTVSSVHDGDTFTCAEQDASGRSIRIRLAGVDARELGDFCARGHPCASAHADDATRALALLAAGQRLTCQPSGSTYGRIAAFCRRPDGTDLSCAMLSGGFVARWDRYWGGHRC